MAEVYPIFSLSAQKVFPTIKIVGMKESVYFPNICSLIKIAEIQGLAGYSRPPQNVNIQADSFWVSSGVWNTIEASNYYHSSVYRGICLRVLETTDEAINSISLTRSGYQYATILPWDNSIAFVKGRYVSGGYVYADLLITDYQGNTKKEGSVLLTQYPTYADGGVYGIAPAGPKHVLIMYWYRESTSYYYYNCVVNYDTMSKSVSDFVNRYVDRPDILHACICSSDGYHANVLLIDTYRYDILSQRFTNGSSRTESTYSYGYDLRNTYDTIFIARNGKVYLVRITNWYGASYYSEVGSASFDECYFYNNNTSRAGIQGIAILDKDRIVGIMFYSNYYYGIGFNVNNGQIITEINFGSSPPIGFHFMTGSGFGRADLWSNNLYVSRLAFFNNTYYRCIDPDTSKFIYDYASSVQFPVFIVGTNLYSVSYDSSSGLFTARWQNLANLYLMLDNNSYLRTKAFNLLRQSSSAVIYAEGFGILTKDLAVRILDQNNNLIAEGKLYDEIKIPSNTTAAKLEIRGNNERYNFVFLIGYGVLYV